MPPVRMHGDGRKAKNPGRTLLRLLGYMRKYIPALLLVMVCIIVAAVAQTAGSENIGKLVDDYILPMVASGSTDFWADPEGEHQSAVLADAVYQLYGNPKMDIRFPAVNSPVVSGAIGYHLRQGPHLLTEYDWACLIDHVEQRF